MKKSLLLSLLVAASTSITALADSIMITGTTWASNGGGEFTVTPTGFGNGPFQTFCVQAGEPINTFVSYDVIPAGGSLTTSAGVDLNKGTAWLFEEFAMGTLDGYDYTAAGRLASAAALQQEIWYLMDGIGSPSSFHQTLVDAAALEVWNIMDDSTEDFSAVKVLNLWENGQAGTAQGLARQDILYIPGVPDGGLTLALLGMGLTGVGIISRRSRK